MLELEITSRLIGSDLSNLPSCPVSVKVVKSLGHSVARSKILSSIIMGRYQRLTGSLVGLGGLTALQRFALSAGAVEYTDCYKTLERIKFAM